MMYERVLGFNRDSPLIHFRPVAQEGAEAGIQS